MTLVEADRTPSLAVESRQDRGDYDEAADRESATPVMVMDPLKPGSSIAPNLAKSLPDTPGWIDVRGMLLSGHAIVSGGETVEAGFVVRTMSGPLAVVAVVGFPAHAAIAQAVEDVTDMTPVIVQRDNADHVGRALASSPPSTSGRGWTPERAILHRLPSESTVDVSDDAPSRLLRADERLDHLPPGLRFEISQARATAPVGIALVDGLPASFCYPCWITETLWDVSIDTLEPYRRRGLAARVVRFMIARMKNEGRDPVWGAMESNIPSLELARKLGFTRADEIIVFSRGPWAYLTRGFQDPGATDSPLDH
jgi:GNAT superfamily N-acetyltransferase